MTKLELTLIALITALSLALASAVSLSMGMMQGIDELKAELIKQQINWDERGKLLSDKRTRAIMCSR